jgi:hypothetical protein
MAARLRIAACRRCVVAYRRLYGVHVINRREHYYLFRFRFVGVRVIADARVYFVRGNRTSRAEVPWRLLARGCSYTIRFGQRRFRNRLQHWGGATRDAGLPCAYILNGNSPINFHVARRLAIHVQGQSSTTVDRLLPPSLSVGRSPRRRAAAAASTAAMQCISRQHQHGIAFIHESAGLAAVAASPVQARGTHPSGAESTSVQVIGVVEQRCRMLAVYMATRTVIGRPRAPDVDCGRSGLGTRSARIAD